MGHRDDIEAVYPLSPVQQGMLFHALLSPGASAYMVQSACVIRGDLKVDLFERAWQRVVDRHSTLRTAFIWEGVKDPLQVVGRRITIRLEQEDWRNLSREEQSKRLDAFLSGDLARGFKFSKAPLMRLALLRLADDAYEFVWTHHHLLLDGWSLPLLLQELFLHYGALEQGSELQLERPRPYQDYIAWLQRQKLADAEAYWRRTLKGFTAATPLITSSNGEGPHAPGVEHAEHRQLSQSLTAQLQAFAKENQLTLNTVMQGGWALVQSRYSREKNVVFGVTVSGRPVDLPGAEAMMGVFINTLPMRVDVRGDESLVPWLKKIQDGQVEMRQYEYSPLIQVQGWSDVPRGHPLFESIYVFENYPAQIDGGKFSAGAQLDEFRMNSPTGFPLAFLVGPGAGLSLQLCYDSAFFDKAAIQRMLGHVESYLEQAIADPKVKLREIGLLRTTERQQILVDWNRTQADAPLNRSLHGSFEAQVERTPDAIAVVFEDEALSYRELNQRANQLARHLRNLGVGPDTPVGVLMERSLEMVVSLYGILKAGGAYLPLDAEYPQQRLALMLEDARVPVLLTQNRLRDIVPAAGATVVALDTEWQRISGECAENLNLPVHGDNLAYVIFTSGSTGRPKGAMNTHAGICNRLVWMQEAYQLTAADRVLQKTPFSFDVSVWEFFWPLLTGARLVVARPGGHRDPAYLVNVISEQEVTTLHFVPSMLRIFLDEPGLEKCTSLKRVIASGEALPFDLQQRFFSRLKSAELHNLYGPTEAAVDVTFWACQKNAKRRLVPIGRPIRNTKIHLLDENLEPVPVGVPGELYIGGMNLARGYFARPDLTAERFVPDSVGTLEGARLYRTGDLARYLEDGEIEYLGRVDHQVKIRGFRIELAEIEAVIAQHPDVREAVVVVREDRAGDQRLIAYAVADPAQEGLVHELKRRAKDRLPENMVPSTIVILEALPLSPNGKIDRRALPAPESARASEEPLVPPRTPMEEEIARIWSGVLGIGTVGVFDNFFELGGHSLLAMQVISRVRSAFKVEIPLRDLFESRTIAGLADAVERAKRSALLPPVSPAPRDGELPLSYPQQGLWFLDQLAPGNAFYNLPVAVRLKGTLDVHALTRAIDEIVRRHESLRTAFETVDGQPRQVISSEVRVTVPVVDLTGEPDTSRETRLRRIVVEEAQRPFDLGRGPLLRLSLLRLSSDEHVVVATMHHIISDGWSMDVLVRELAALYEAFSTGLPSPLAALPVQYADYAYWQRQWIRGEVLDEHLSYWKKQLAARLVLQIPADHPRPAVQTFRGSMHRFELPGNLYIPLQEMLRKQGVTLFMASLAAFQAFLYRYTGQDDIVVGSPVANRNRTELEGLIGYFVNTLVLRTDLSGNPSFREILARVRETTLGALAHQDLPFEKLVEALRPERDLSHDPLFQVLFVLQNASSARVESRGGLTIELVDSPTDTAKFDLTLFITEGENGLSGALEYNTDLFEAGTIRRMAENFCSLFGEMVAEPARKLSEFSLLGRAERESLLVEWNQTQKDFSRDACIHQFVERQAGRTPDAVAVVSGKSELTYRELNRRSNQLARYLRNIGIGPQAVAGICMQRSLDMVVAIFGVLKAGAAYVPFDPAYPAERLAAMLEDAQVPLLLTDSQLARSLPRGYAQMVCLDSDWENISQEDGENPDFPVTPDHRVYAIFTSGSTGRPKLAAVYHRGFVNLLEWFVRDFSIDAEDRTLLVSSFNFDLTQKNIYAPLMTGGRLYLADSGVFDPTALRNSIEQDRITLLNCTPSAFYPLVDQAGEKMLGQLRSLRQVFLGGEPISLARLRNWTTSSEFHAEFVNTYGPTECTDICAFYRIEDPVHFEGPVPIGKPVFNVELYVLDANLAAVPIGVPGELCVAGEGVGQGYLNDPELTARKFIPNSFVPGEGRRLYRTGDLVRYLPTGDIEYLGRIDHQIKIRGFRVELGEIESVLREHGSIKEAVVLAREDTPGEKWLAGYVVANDKASSAIQLSETELRRFLRSRLPDYMVPSAFVVLEALPLTPNGKLDRRALPVPDRSQRRSSSAFAPPTTRQEAALATILAELLGMETVGIHDNFFELGGDSIMAIQLIARASRAGLRISPSQVFQYQTIAELAAFAGSPVDVTAQQGPVEGPVLLSPVQQRFFALTDVDPHHFNHAFLLEVRTPLDAGLLKTAVEQILAHHDALRMRFEKSDSGWLQRNASSDESRVDQVFIHRDLTALSGTDQIQTVETEAARLEASLNLTEGPLIRVAYFDMGSSRSSRLLMIIHHLVVDGISWRILMSDLLMAYQQLQRGQAVTLPAKTTSFQEWAGRLPEYARSEKVRQELDFWLAERHSRIQPMPVDFPGRPNTAENLESVLCSLNPEETRALLQDVPSAFRTQINDALLTALAGAFHQWTGQTSLLIELEGHGRESIADDIEISRTVGWFTSLYPVYLELKDPGNPANALRSIRQQLDAIPNRGIGYGLLRYLSEDAEIRGRLQSQPIPEITFNYHGQVDQSFGGDDSIVGAQESAGPAQSPRQMRTQLLDIIGGVSDGELRLAWTYNADLHRRSTIEQLAQYFVEQLRGLITASRDPRAREYRPADFPLTSLNQEQLNKVLKKVARPVRRG